MFEVKTIMEQLTGPVLTNSLIALLEQNFEDFPSVRELYQEAIAQAEKGEELAEAINAQTASDLLFSAVLGLKANLDHFRDPVARTFLEVDPEIYLRETIAHSLPQYIEAQKIRDAADATMTSSPTPHIWIPSAQSWRISAATCWATTCCPESSPATSLIRC